MLGAHGTAELKEEDCSRGLSDFPVFFVDQLTIAIARAGTQPNILGLKVGLYWCRGVFNLFTTFGVQKSPKPTLRF